MSDSHYTVRSISGGDRITWAVQRLILLNTLVFVGQLLLFIPFGYARPFGLDAVTEWLSFRGDRLDELELWRPLTYMFLHGGLMHLFVNMLLLFFFGPEVERALGTRQFLYFYVICGAVGVMATLLPLPLLFSDAPVLGASGAVMAVLVAFAMINPDRELFLFPIPMPINARVLVLIVVVLNLFSSGAGTSTGAHFGGMAAGYLYMKFKPRFLSWQMQTRSPKPAKQDPVGDAVDNIFDFRGKKRGEKK